MTDASTAAMQALKIAWRRMARHQRHQRSYWASIFGVMLLMAWVSLAITFGFEWVSRIPPQSGSRPDFASLAAHNARQLLFWFNIAQITLISYSTFENIFRRTDASLLLPLPIIPQSWFWLIFKDMWIKHVLIAITGIAVATGIGIATGYILAISWVIGCLTIFSVQLVLSCWLHLRLGETLYESKSDPLRAMLTQGLAATQAAYLFYSPAFAFALGAALVLFIDIVFRLVDETGSPIPWAIVTASTTLFIFLTIRSAVALFSKSFATILPRFWETETVDPFRETYLPKPPRTLVFGKLLTLNAQPFFRLYVVQMRRRYRVDGLLYIIVLLTLSMIVLRNESETIASWAYDVTWALWANIMFFYHVPRVLGRAVSANSLTWSLPVSQRTLMMAQRLAVLPAMLPVPAALAPLLLVAGYSVPLTLLGVITALILPTLAIIWGIKIGSNPTLSPRAFHWILRTAASFMLGICAMYA